jgi:hypothetical protein
LIYFDLDLLRASAEVLDKGAFATAGGAAVAVAAISLMQFELLSRPLRADYFSKDEKLLVARRPLHLTSLIPVF